ncbi:hypothetical protein BJ508DRAFT_302411 [Ascobolus immersus RN42]|uniref:Uncharacterized protein n=1 Tax=Ascobolus immersus RN42 TaxID=1160509 RepID=A0A3N4IIR5_ASCIM|nr:hypothetical protein BJ508DRAFT_302411 [Ascobolus immersus RN42]
MSSTIKAFFYIIFKLPSFLSKCLWQELKHLERGIGRRDQEIRHIENERSGVETKGFGVSRPRDRACRELGRSGVETKRFGVSRTGDPCRERGIETNLMEFSVSRTRDPVSRTAVPSSTRRPRDRVCRGRGIETKGSGVSRTRDRDQGIRVSRTRARMLGTIDSASRTEDPLSTWRPRDRACRGRGIETKEFGMSRTGDRTGPEREIGRRERGSMPSESNWQQLLSQLVILGRAEPLIIAVYRKFAEQVSACRLPNALNSLSECTNSSLLSVSTRLWLLSGGRPPDEAKERLYILLPKLGIGLGVLGGVVLIGVVGRYIYRYNRKKQGMLIVKPVAMPAVGSVNDGLYLKKSDAVVQVAPVESTRSAKF